MRTCSKYCSRNESGDLLCQQWTEKALSAGMVGYGSVKRLALVSLGTSLFNRFLPRAGEYIF